jgi:hypothetical protein
MSTITSSVSNSAANPAYPQLSRALTNLSARAQPAAPEETAESAADPTDLVQEIAQQNSLSALADGAAALGATQSAQGLIAGQPALALASQATVAPETAWSLLQD